MIIIVLHVVNINVANNLPTSQHLPDKKKLKLPSEPGKNSYDMNVTFLTI